MKSNSEPQHIQDYHALIKAHDDDLNKTGHAVGRYVASLEKSRDTARDAYFAAPSVEGFKSWVEADTLHVSAYNKWVESQAAVDAIIRQKHKDGDSGRKTLAKALRARAAQIREKAESIERDLREIASRTGTDFSETPAITKLRDLAERADNHAAFTEGWRAELGQRSPWPEGATIMAESF